MKRISLIFATIFIIFGACDRKPQLPASSIIINGKEYRFYNITTTEGSRSPISAIYSHNTASYNAENLETKFWLTFSLGNLPLGEDISLVRSTREGAKEVQFQIHKPDTLYRPLDYYTMTGSYDNGIVKYTIDNIRMETSIIDYVHMPIPTSDTAIVSATIYAYSEQ